MSQRMSQHSIAQLSSRAPRGRPGARAARALALGGALLLPLGCGNDVAPPPPNPDLTQLYWALTLDQHALTLDSLPPYDTVRLVATPRRASGDTLGGEHAAVTYVSTDLAHVRVSADGLVQAVKSTGGTPVPVVATLRVGAYTHVDTAWVDVTALGSPPTLATFALQADSTRWAIGGQPFGSLTTSVTLQALDGAAAPLPAFLVAYRSSDPTIAKIDPATGEITGLRPGTVRLSASATLYGVRKADTLAFTITGPLQVSVDLVPPFLGAASLVFSPADVTIEAGGVILWGISTNLLPPEDTTVVRPPIVLDVAFDQPVQALADPFFCGQLLVLFGASCEGGDVAAFGDTTRVQYWTHYVENVRTRQFVVPGTYPYHSSLLHTSGTIHVIHTP